MASFLKSQKGFSLIELLTVVGILGVLSAVAIVQYGKYKIGALQSAQKAELSEVAKAMEYAHSVDGGYHQKIWAAGYRPNKIMQVNIGLDYSPSDSLCCSSHPQSSAGNFEGYLTLSKDVYDTTKIASAVTAGKICHPDPGTWTSKCQIKKTNGQKPGDVKRKHQSPSDSDDVCAGTNPGANPDSGFHNKDIKCDCDKFIVSSSFRVTAGQPRRAYINHEGALCKGAAKGKGASLEVF